VVGTPSVPAANKFKVGDRIEGNLREAPKCPLRGMAEG
jgi:hypothetical protein